MRGLSEEEAKRLLEKYGYNEIVEKKVNPILKFLSYFWGPIPWMIEIALILSAIIKHWVDFYIILVLLIVNGVVGFYQEGKAEKAIELLKSKLAPKARVLRDGVWKVIDAKYLVPGDVVKVRIGDIAPADIEVVEGEGEFDESALTGESLPVDKKKGDIVYSGSICRRGEIVGVVKATGMNTYFGKTAKLVEVERVSRYQKLIIRIGDFLIILAIAVIVFVILVALSRNENPIEIVRFALVLMVAAIPAALPAVMSVTMAIGAINLARRNAIVRRLVAIEEMAGVDVLCADKTGTLTENRLTCGEPITFGFSRDEVFTYASLASEGGDPIDDAILSVKPKPEHKLIEFKPWDPVRKRVEAVVEYEGKVIRVTKGAPQVISELTGENVEDYVNKLAEEGYRAIAVAVDFGDGWKLVGIIPLYDPPRKDAKEMIETAKSMGVEVKMITGDHVAIARKVARELGLGDKAVLMKEIVERKRFPEIARIVEENKVFAEVFPEHKYLIVDALQKHNHIVAMTGDGVNDAPALKKADVGIAVYNATDAAKSSADIVLSKPGIRVIIDAIKESRRIFQRMHSYAVYRIAETIRVLFFIALSIIVFNFYPVTAVMIILLALLNDIPILSIAYDNVRISNRPERWNMEELLVVSTFLGILGVISSFTLFFIAVKMGIDHETLKTLMFLKLAVAGHLTIFVTRTRDYMWSIKPGKLLFWSAVGTKLVATIFAVLGILMTPISVNMAIAVWIYCLAWMLISDYAKVKIYRRI